MSVLDNSTRVKDDFILFFQIQLRLEFIYYFM